VAGDLFLAHGYRRVSIDQIVEAVPISKPTLYAHFKDKSELFLATTQRRCQKLMEHMQSTIEAGQTVDETLFGIGYHFLEMVMTKQSIQMHRILCAEIEDFPAAAKLFFNSGPNQMHLLLANYLSEQHRKKKLKVKDAELSADMFLSMIKGYAHLKRLLGVEAPPSKKRMQHRVRYAVDLFLTAHAI
jgi:TetR/AcrR family transcriptional repressor of mexJK operon